VATATQEYRVGFFEDISVLVENCDGTDNLGWSVFERGDYYAIAHSRILVFFREKFLNLRFEVCGFCCRSKTLNCCTVRTHQELGKVPLDARSKHSTGMVLYKLENWMGLGTINVNLGGEREVHPVIERAEFLNLCVVTWLLVCELITRESEYDQSLGPEFFIEFLKAVVLRGEATLAGGIYNQDGLAAIGIKVNFIALVIGKGQVIQGI
jgi:hypothetical protein